MWCTRSYLLQLSWYLGSSNFIITASCAIFIFVLYRATSHCDTQGSPKEGGHLGARAWTVFISQGALTFLSIQCAFWIMWILQPRGKNLGASSYLWGEHMRKIELWRKSEVKTEFSDITSWAVVMLIIITLISFSGGCGNCWTSKTQLSPMEHDIALILQTFMPVSNHWRFWEHDYISLPILRSHCWLDLEEYEMNAGPAMFASRTILGLETCIILLLKIFAEQAMFDWVHPQVWINQKAAWKPRTRHPLSCAS